MQPRRRPDAARQAAMTCLLLPFGCRQCAWNAGTLAVTARREASASRRRVYASWEAGRMAVYGQLKRALEQLGVVDWVTPAEVRAEERVNGSPFAGREVSYNGMRLDHEGAEYWQLTGTSAPSKNIVKPYLDMAEALRQAPFEGWELSLARHRKPWYRRFLDRIRLGR